jgi:hypothetical protein
MMFPAFFSRFAIGLAALAACGAFYAAPSAWAQGAGKAGATVSPSSPATPTSSAPSATGTPIPSTPPPTTSHGTHVVTVTFDYDFRQTPACTPKIPSHCVMQFIAYDISVSAKNPTMLFPIPLPQTTTGLVKAISKASPLLDFESGKHLIAVSAMSPDGSHSKRNLCTTWITIP